MSSGVTNLILVLTEPGDKARYYVCLKLTAQLKPHDRQVVDTWRRCYRLAAELGDTKESEKCLARIIHRDPDDLHAR